MLIDTHCHIHSAEFFTPEQAEEALNDALEHGVTKIIAVATSLADSKDAIAFAHAHPKNVWATIGIHPHEAANLTKEQIRSQLSELAELAADSKVVGVGECGFDFYYNDRAECYERQKQLLIGQLEIAKKHSLPLSFHVREAFSEFWPVFESYSGLTGVLHSFTDRPEHMERAVKHGLCIGINGIATFTSHLWQKEMFKQIPLNNIVVETDAPFLTPKPKRGTMNKPENVTYITKYLAELRGEDATDITRCTTNNAERLFGLSVDT